MKQADNITNIKIYFQKLYSDLKHTHTIGACNINNINFSNNLTKEDKLYFTEQYIKWLEHLLIVNYNYGVYRLLLKISKEWRMLHIDIERKQNIQQDPIKIVIDTEDRSNVK